MGQPAPRAVTTDLADGEQRFVLYGISWEQYEAMRAATDHLRSVRMTYLEGALELMSPGNDHEWVKKGIARGVPDIAIEVVVSVGMIDKLEVYRGLEVPEVWVWEEGRLTVWQRADDGYHAAERSRLLPDLDLAQLLTYVTPDDQTAATRAYRDALRG